jgi:hypothetical protein
VDKAGDHEWVISLAMADVTESIPETLRRAARLMRERAQRADTGEPWESDRHYDALYVVDLKPSLGPVANSQAWVEAHLGRDDVYEFEQPRFLAALHEIADHIASWHPAVALAVAQWLYTEAEQAGTSPAATPSQMIALAVAHAYLGESE